MPPRRLHRSYVEAVYLARIGDRCGQRVQRAGVRDALMRPMGVPGWPRGRCDRWTYEPLRNPSWCRVRHAGLYPRLLVVCSRAAMRSRCSGVNGGNESTTVRTGSDAPMDVKPLRPDALADGGLGQSGLMRSHAGRVRPSGSAFAGFRFPPDVIIVAIRWYLRYGLSYRDVEELLAERGIEVDHVTVFRWCSASHPC
jgi:hypothetical protein